jgi:ATP-binding cassette subfamily F protein 3
MTVLSAHGLKLSFAGHDVLTGVSFSLNEGDKLGIIGTNGAGKTSLFRILSGKIPPDSGDVFIQKGCSIGTLEQNPDFSALPSEISCIDYMYTAFPHLLDIEEKITEHEKQIEMLSACGDDERAAHISGELSELSQKYARLGGLEFRARCRGMLLRLGFNDEIINRKISTLSGGQYMRLALARLLASEPDILMLDEPTNHLDIDTLAWLESFLATYKKTVLIISHDRYFLDKITDKTLHILYGSARLYNGNYTRAKAQMEADAESLEKRYKEQQKEIARIRANIEFQKRCNREHNFVTIRSKEKQLARMEKVELAPPPPKDIRVRFLSEGESAGDVLSVRDLSFGYNGKTLIKNLSFLIRRYERVMVLGQNGCGKSTLMKLICGRVLANSGALTLGYNIKIGYYDQENCALDKKNTVFSEMRAEYPLKTDLELRSTLALFLFGADDMDKSISALSGGERARLTLAKLMLKKVNLLVLDEPTNHLDIGSREALEEALTAFDGTIIAVSHDRYFINRIATRIIELDAKSSTGMRDVVLEEGDDAFTEYLALREKTREPNSNTESEKPKSSKEEYERKKEAEREARARERKIAKAHERIAEIESTVSKLDSELFTSAQSDYVRAAEIYDEKNKLEEELLELYELVM